MRPGDGIAGKEATAMNEMEVRYDATMRRCRTIERHAATLRAELLWLASGDGDRRRVDRALDALREQLARAQRLADTFADRHVA